jgi:hypothetical protein
LLIFMNCRLQRAKAVSLMMKFKRCNVITKLICCLACKSIRYLAGSRVTHSESIGALATLDEDLHVNFPVFCLVTLCVLVDRCRRFERTCYPIFMVEVCRFKVPLRPTVSRSVSLGVEPPLGLMTRC